MGRERGDFRNVLLFNNEILEQLCKSRGLNLEYWSKKYPIESGVRCGLGWSCRISFMESAVMVNRIFWSGVITALSWECNKHGTGGQFQGKHVPVGTGIWENFTPKDQYH